MVANRFVIFIRYADLWGFLRVFKEGTVCSKKSSLTKLSFKQIYKKLIMVSKHLYSLVLQGIGKR